METADGGWTTEVRVRFTVVVLSVGALLSCAHAEPSPVRRDFLGGRVTAAIPTGFASVDQKPLLANDLITARAATVLMNPAHTARIEIVGDEGAARRSQSQFDAPVKQLLALIDSGVKGLNPSAEWLKDEVTSIQGRPFLVLDFRSSNGVARTRQMIALTSVHGDAIVVAFSCPEDSEAMWAPVGKAVIDSVIVKD